MYVVGIVCGFQREALDFAESKSIVNDACVLTTNARMSVSSSSSPMPTVATRPVCFV